MSRILRIAVAVLIAAGFAAPCVGNAQNFAVDKWNIGGDGSTDYLTVEAGTGRVFVSRGTHVMVVDGLTGKLLGEIVDTPRTHGIGIAANANHGFTTNGGDSSVTMFDLKTLAVIKKIKVPNGGLDGITYDEDDDRIILTNHSRPTGTLVAIDPDSGNIVGTVELEDTAPEGAAANGKRWIFVNNEKKNTIQVVDVTTWKAIKSWPLAPCEGPRGIAYDRTSDRIFVSCDRTSVVVSGTSGNVVVVHQDSPDTYTIVATVSTMRGAKTISVDSVTHRAYLFQPEYGPPPAADPRTTAPPSGGRGGSRGPVVAAWLFAIHH